MPILGQVRDLTPRPLTNVHTIAFSMISSKRVVSREQQGKKLGRAGAGEGTLNAFPVPPYSPLKLLLKEHI